MSVCVCVCAIASSFLSKVFLYRPVSLGMEVHPSPPPPPPQWAIIPKLRAPGGWEGLAINYDDDDYDNVDDDNDDKNQVRPGIRPSP